jgi:hypothetical protein
MTETLVQVQSVELKGGVSQKTGKPYRQVVVTDGNNNRATSFDVALFEKAKPFEGKQALLETKPNGNFTDLLDIKEAPAANGDTPALGTGEYVRGQTAPTDARRMLACNAATNGVALAAEILRHAVGREITLAFANEIAQKCVDERWMDLLRKSDMMEDRDLPF